MICRDQIEAKAKALWERDYPNGGSIFPTFESTMEDNKKLYREEARQVLDVEVENTNKVFLIGTKT